MLQTVKNRDTLVRLLSYHTRQVRTTELVRPVLNRLRCILSHSAHFITYSSFSFSSFDRLQVCCGLVSSAVKVDACLVLMQPFGLPTSSIETSRAALSRQ